MLELKLRHWESQMQELVNYNPLPTLNVDDGIPDLQLMYRQMSREDWIRFWTEYLDDREVAFNMYY